MNRALDQRFEYNGKQMVVCINHYATEGHPMAVVIESSLGERYATLSVNIPDVSLRLKPGQFFAKTWSENAMIARAALASGIFVDTGLRIPTGFVEAHLWEIKDFPWAPKEPLAQEAQQVR
jgi:hypothetical protein